MKDRSNLPLNYREKSNSRISLLGSIAVLIVLVLVFQRLDYNMVRKPAKEAAEAQEAQKEAEEKAANAVQVDTVTFLAAGDNIYYTRLYESGQYNGVWNYDHVYEKVAPTIKQADLSLVCQETTFATSHDLVANYPNFATPTEVGDALVNAGFDLIASASDHANDHGAENIKNTLNFWNTNHPDTTVLGIHNSAEVSKEIPTVTVNGITIAFLNYTFDSYNSLLDEGTSGMVNLFEQLPVSNMIEDAKKYSDCIVFVAHWGNDGETVPNEYQKQWANFLMEQGVNVLIGSHPHVLQPYGRMSDDSGHEMVVFYSLGSFVSSLQTMDELLSGFAGFTIERTIQDGIGSIKILDPYIEPLVMHYEYEQSVYTPYLLKDYTDQLASAHSVRDYIGDQFTLANLEKRFDEIMSQNVEPSTQRTLLSEGSSANSGSQDTSSEDSDSYSEDDYSDYDYDYSEESYE